MASTHEVVAHMRLGSYLHIPCPNEAQARRWAAVCELDPLVSSVEIKTKQSSAD